MPGYSAATSLKTRCQRSWAWISTLDLSAITTFVAARARARARRRGG